MNKHTLKSNRFWQISCQESFAPVYPLSTLGANDRIREPGTR